MVVHKRFILRQEQIRLKLQRIALEIAEQNTDEQHLVIAGIEPNGSIMASRVAPVLQEYFDGKITCISVTLDKRNPGEITVNGVPPDLNDAVLILMDDVANSGKTLTYALKPFLEYHPRKIQTAVLVARTHRIFPIQPDYIGFRLATTIQEYIDVEVQDGELIGAWMA